MTAILLFCTLALSPVDCDEVTARHYERVPGTALPFMCLKQGQEWAAEHGIEPQAGEYMKVRCSRSEFGGGVG